MDYIKDLLIWCTKNYIELIATVSGFIYLIYSVLGNKKLWFFGLVTSLLYVFVFFNAGVYADMGINIYYVIVSIYGWVHWTFYRNDQTKELPVSRIKLKEIVQLGAVTLLIFFLIYFVLNKFTDSDIAIWDSITTAASITGTWMLARKILEHWLVWIFVDTLSVGLYIYKELYPTVALFIVYTIFSIVGFYQWKKEWKQA